MNNQRKTKQAFEGQPVGRRMAGKAEKERGTIRVSRRDIER